LWEIAVVRGREKSLGRARVTGEEVSERDVLGKYGMKRWDIYGVQKLKRRASPREGTWRKKIRDRASVVIRCDRSGRKKEDRSPRRQREVVRGENPLVQLKKRWASGKRGNFRRQSFGKKNWKKILRVAKRGRVHTSKGQGSLQS